MFILSCSQVSQKIDPSVFYMRDMKIKVNERESRGVLVAMQSALYKIEIESPGDMDLLQLISCHREIMKKDLGKKTTFLYAPAFGVEDGELTCPVILTGLNSKGSHSWGLIDFESDFHIMYLTQGWGRI